MLRALIDTTISNLDAKSQARRRLWLGLGVSLLVSLWLVAWLDIRKSQALALEHAQARIGIAAHNRQAQAQRVVQQVEQMTLGVAVLVEDSGIEGAGLISRVMLESGALVQVIVVDAGGRARIGWPLYREDNLGHLPEFVLHRDVPEIQNLQVHLPRYGVLRRRWVVPFSRRLADHAGQFVGMVGVQVPPEELVTGLPPEELGESAFAALVRDDGTVLAWQGSTGWSEASSPDVLKLEGLVDEDRPKGLRILTLNGRSFLAQQEALQDYPLSLVVGLSEKEAYEEYYKARDTTLLRTAVATAVLLMAGFIILLQLRQLANRDRILLDSRRRYEAAADLSGDAFLMLQPLRDKDGAIVSFECMDMNSKASQLIDSGVGPAFGISRPGHRVEISDDVVMQCRLALESGKPEVETRGLIHHGEERWWSRRALPVLDSVALVLQDVTTQKRTERGLERLAFVDPVTGLGNRRACLRYLHTQVDEAKACGSTVVLLHIDLDNFKAVNDLLGHEHGDFALATVAKRLEGARHGKLFRVGGDEFMLVASGLESSKVAELCLEVLALVARPLELDMMRFDITASIGVACYPKHGSTGSELVRCADMAMYQAKEEGKNHFRFFAEAARQLVAHRQTIESGLKRALERDELFLVYQPKVDLRTGEVKGLEALVRWTRGSQVVGPGDFISIVEKSSLILALDAWVVEHTCRQLRGWLADKVPVVPVAVNLSARQFASDDLVERIERRLGRYGLDAQLLEVEITENVMMNDPRKALGTVRRLREMGVCTAIDDFGTGYSSLALLEQLPVSTLKLDRSFLQPRGTSTGVVLSSMVRLGRTLGLQTVAEGVETLEQLALLKELGCNQVQGYLIAKPMTAEATAEFLRRSAGVNLVRDLA